VDKKGIELSVNFLVIIIIAIVVFFFGARFIYNLASEATELGKLTLDELDTRIGDLICEGSEKVCLGINRKVIERGKLDIFELKMMNILKKQDFDIFVSKSGGFTGTGNPIAANNLLIFPESRNIPNLERNSEKNLGIGIEVPKDAVSGTYIFDVSICFNNPDIDDDPLGDCGTDTYSFNKIYVEVP
jgi:hypothetical protein|tara:strand:- start:164 stop:724 length:561 start_codon:yes stop_codon:yes gene_type:complete